MYTDLKSFQQASIIYDFTVAFCDRYIDKMSRTHDQMVQAARSGKQNIAEGSSVSKTDPKNELFLLGVARGSLKELLEDYEDFLRQRGLSQWRKEDPRAQGVRRLAYGNRSDRTDKSYRLYMDEPERAANVMITLINQTNFLLDQQIKAVRRQLEEKGIWVESQNQKAARILAEQKKGEERFQKWMESWMKKSERRGKTNRTDKL